MKSLEERYLERMSELYPSIAKASTEIINLSSTLNLPKGTEHFITDIHGEYEAFSKAYQGETGIAGYTLIFNSRGLRLVAHEPFTSTEDAIRRGTDIHSDNVMVEKYTTRLMVGDTDQGQRLREHIAELEELLQAYRSGQIAEKV